ncbi:Transcriptional regulator ure2 [Conoideocrella luteorostrata]|uniref:Transcriptional regulator ure2 n=1 Tax=Conoideocrella luteorostrata TaxID=1105319 RepID=A0AAJ0CYL4_9HYPO|nr:Transcriptional regulator ure2 [Conoideocrella luteorostrata]
MPTIKPVKVWGKGGPNPPKVAMVLEELGVPYELVAVPLADVKKPDYLAVNPNGRLPSIYDPNTNLTLWESGAIVEYLVEKYDTDHKISFEPGSLESYHAKQFLFFQASGQGPYYGQAGWFKLFHHEKVPSALDRYIKEVNRVTGVLEKVLAEKAVTVGDDGPWLVGGKYSFADIAFISWQNVITAVLDETEYKAEDFPYVKAWMERMKARPAIHAALGTPERLE